MEKAFLNIVQMSISAGYVILVVMLIRLALRKAPKKYSYALWSVVAFRLLCPFSVRSAFSIFNLRFGRKETPAVDLSGVPVVQNQAAEVTLDTGIPVMSQTLEQVIEVRPSVPAAETVGEVTGGTIGETVTSLPQGTVPVRTAVSATTVLSWIWVIGMILLIAYAVFSYVRIRRRMQLSMPYRDNIRQAEIRTPFILGFLRPTIYIPFGLEPIVENVAVSHERCHIRRGDPFIKLFSYLLLTVHWFNPLCWLAYLLMGKDMEMSCDEYVVSHYRDIAKDYSTALLSFSTGKRFSLASPLAFGESNVRERIVNVIRQHKRSGWMSLLAGILCVAVLVVCGTNSVQADVPEPWQAGEVSVSSQPEEEPFVFVSYPAELPGGGITRGYQPGTHLGYDIWGEYGKGILAVADGTVVTAEAHDQYGNYIVIDHGNGYRTLYAHCDELLVRKGDTVRGGETIARMGDSGNATGVHVHFELQDENGNAIDPTVYLDAVSSGLAESVFEARSQRVGKEGSDDNAGASSLEIRLNTLKEVCSLFDGHYCNENGIHLTETIASRFQPEDLWDEQHTFLTDVYEIHLSARFDDPVLRPDCTVEGCDHQSPSCEAWALRSAGYPVELPLGERTLFMTQVRQASLGDERFPTGTGLLIESMREEDGKPEWQTAIPNVTLVDSKMYFDGRYLVFLVSKGIQVLDTQTGEVVKEVYYETVWTDSFYVTKDNRLVLVDKALKMGYLIDTSTWQRTRIKDILNGPEWYDLTYDGSSYIADPLYDTGGMEMPQGTDHAQIFMVRDGKALVRFSGEKRDETAIVDQKTGKILSGTVPMKNIYGENIPSVNMETGQYYVFRAGVVWNGIMYPAPPDYFDGLNNGNTATYRYVYGFIDKDAFWNGETAYTAFVLP